MFGSNFKEIQTDLSTCTDGEIELTKAKWELIEENDARRENFDDLLALLYHYHSKYNETKDLNPTDDDYERTKADIEELTKEENKLPQDDPRQIEILNEIEEILLTTPEHASNQHIEAVSKMEIFLENLSR